MTDLIVDGLVLKTDVDVDLGDLARPADLAAALREYLEGVTRLVQAAPRLRPDGQKYVVYEELVLDQGRAWTSAALPRGAPRGRMGYCYANTLHLTAIYPGLRYVEGFAIPWVGGRAGAPIEHAWAVNAAGRVWDPTWPEPQHSAYFGLVFSRADVARFINLDEDTFGILATEHLIGSPLLRTGRLWPDGSAR